MKYWCIRHIPTGRLVASRVAAAPHLYLTKNVAKANLGRRGRRYTEHEYEVVEVEIVVKAAA